MVAHWDDLLAGVIPGEKSVGLGVKNVNGEIYENSVKVWKGWKGVEKIRFGKLRRKILSRVPFQGSFPDLSRVHAKGGKVISRMGGNPCLGKTDLSILLGFLLKLYI